MDNRIFVKFGTLKFKKNDMVHAKLKKMLEMLIMLGNKYGRTKKGMASHFEISQKTVGRYFETFREAGFILEQDNGYWKINKNESNYKDLSQLLHFSQEESLILRNAIDSIRAPESIIEELTHKLYSIYNFDRVATPIIKSANEDKIVKIEDSIKNKKRVYLNNYKSSNSSNKKDRLVEAFDFTHNYRSVWAYEVDSKQSKMFVLARIQEVELTTEEWKNEKEHKKLLPDIFRMTGDEEYLIKIKLTLRAKNLLVEEYPLSEEYIKEISDNEYILETKLYSLEGVGRFVKGLINEVEIIKPKILKDKISDDLKKYLKKNA